MYLRKQMMRRTEKNESTCIKSVVKTMNRPIFLYIYIYFFLSEAIKQYEFNERVEPEHFEKFFFILF